jgi:glycosyltransferase involved in cell wall biosynthesis
MKILVATPLYPPDSGGPAVEALFLEKNVPREGIQVATYSFGTIRHLPSGIRHIWYAWGLLTRARNVDCIVAIDTFSVCVPAAFVAWLLQKRFVVRVPGQFSWEQATQRFGVHDDLDTFQKNKYDFRVEVIRFLERKAVGSADLVVVPSDYFKGIVKMWGIPEERLQRIYLGMEFKDEIVAPSTVPQGKILVSLGRLVPWKGFSMLIDLMSELSPDWQLVIIGDGPDRVKLEEKMKTLNLGGKVTFTGAVSHQEVLGWLARADAFALNTSFESFSFQILEAMWSGVPVITTTAGSIPELVKNGVEGVLCEPNNREAFKQALQSIETEPEVWKHRIEAAKKKSQEFTAERSAHAFAEALKKLCV